MTRGHYPQYRSMKLLLAILLSLTAAMATVEAKEVLLESDDVIIWVGTPDEMADFIREYLAPDFQGTGEDLKGAIFANGADELNQRYVYFVNEDKKGQFLPNLAIYFSNAEMQLNHVGPRMQQMQMEILHLQMQLAIATAGDEETP